MCHVKTSIYRCGHVHTAWVTCERQPANTAVCSVDGGTGNCDLCQSWRSPVSSINSWNVCFLRELKDRDDDHWECCQCGFAGNVNDAPSCMGTLVAAPPRGAGAGVAGSGAAAGFGSGGGAGTPEAVSCICDHAICKKCLGVAPNGKRYTIGKRSEAMTPKKRGGEELGAQYQSPRKKARYLGPGFHQETDMGFHLCWSDVEDGAEL